MDMPLWKTGITHTAPKREKSKTIKKLKKEVNDCVVMKIMCLKFVNQCKVKGF